MAHREQVGREKRRAYLDWDYWAKPVPSFGDPKARLLLIGLAPGAHGANRTGRMFTGDRSGDFLYRALHTASFANQAESRGRDDGLHLRDCYISAAGRCAPPDNKPTPEELRRCRPFLERELALLRKLKVVVALGRIAFDAYLGVLRDQQAPLPPKSALTFAHGAIFAWNPGFPILIASYHPSQQNTSTGRLTPAMFDEIFAAARGILES